jgi:hypothetical protein
MMIMYRSIFLGSLGIAIVFAIDKPTAPTPTPTFDDFGFRIVGGENAEPGYFPFFGKCKFRCISLKIS